MKKLVKLLILIMLLLIISSCKAAIPKNYKPKTSIKNDGHIDKDKILHINEYDFFVNGIDNYRIILKTEKNDVEKAFIFYKDNEKKEMQSIGENNMYSFFSVDLEIKEEDFSYYFSIIDGKTEIYYGSNGVKNKSEIDRFEKNIENINYNYKKDNINIVYKIFIDSYYNGKVENDPQFNEFGPSYFLFNEEKNIIPYVDVNKFANTESKSYGYFNIRDRKKNWYEYDKWEELANKEIKWDIKNSRHFGGDIQGIVEKIPYLIDKKIDTIWINPPFFSYSNHKYNIIDYRHISPDFATTVQVGDIDKDKYKDDKIKIYSKENAKEYELLLFNTNENKNGLSESIDEKTWLFTESDIEFIEFINKLHENNIKIIVDLPINYTSKHFFAFYDAIVNGPTSKYAKWYKFSDWEKTDNYSGLNLSTWNPPVKYSGKAKIGVYQNGDEILRTKWVSIPKDATYEEKLEIFNWNIENIDYECWMGSKELPILNYKEKSVREFIKQSTLKWVKGIGNSGIDGYRIDDILSVNLDFLLELEAEYKKYNENFIVIGDIWKNQLKDRNKYNIDYTTIYELNKMFIDWLINENEKFTITLSDFINNQYLFYKSIPNNYVETTLNMIDGFNTDRMLSMLINGDRDFDTKNSNTESNYLLINPEIYDNKIVNKYEKLLVFQFFNIGVPVVYYGTEVGMWGGDAPDSRKPMFWENEPHEKESDKISKYKLLLDEFGQNKEMIIDEANKTLYYPVEKNYDIVKSYDKIVKAYSEDKELFKYGTIKYYDIINDNCIIFERVYENRKAIVVINKNSEETKLVIPYKTRDKFVDILSEKKVSYDVIDEKIEINLRDMENYILYKK